MSDKDRQTKGWGKRREALAAWLHHPSLWVGLLLLGLAARFRQYLGNPSYWYDEAFTAVDIFDLPLLKLLGPLPGQSIIPPFFLWLLRGCYLSLGPQEWALRLPAFLAGIAALLLMIVLARRWFGAPGWLWMVAFCALSTHAVNHSVEVRPYATDFLSTVTILLASHAYLRSPDLRSRRWGGGGLLLASALAPWLSFTSAFVLTAAGTAVLLHYLHHKGRGRLLFWLGLNGLLAGTCFLVWFLQARNLYYPGLKHMWTYTWPGFPPDHSLGTLLPWTLRSLVEMAHYATTGLGIPLLLLGTVGLVRCWRRSREEALLLAGPVLIAYLASLLGKYPIADRTIFFLAPCVWLLAVEGLLDLAQRLPAAASFTVPLLVLGLLAPGLVENVRRCARVEPRMEYREALMFVQEHRSQDDAVWNWCPDLATVYFDHIFGWQPKPIINGSQYTPRATQEALAHPLWVIAPNNVIENMVGPLRVFPVQQTLCRQFYGVKVLRFASVFPLPQHSASSSIDFSMIERDNRVQGTSKVSTR